jgi:transposase
MATAHLILRIIYAMLRDKKDYDELGADYLGSREKSVEYWVRKIQAMGFEVELKEVHTA